MTKTNKIGSSDQAKPGLGAKTTKNIQKGLAYHIALYRKYRPESFADVAGQDAVVEALSGAIKAGNISHAYLFAGSRGTGKTSVARIFARAVGVSDDDLYEIDAASNRGIDDIRAIREAVNTLPFSSPYKLYLVDEVHMLTKDAFNALLKTLEEPPAHVIFILATTEMQKLPETVVSRCQVFQFKKPSLPILKDTVLKIAKAEGLKLDSASAEIIALVGDGSFRDTIGVLEKVVNISADKTISADEVAAITSAPKTELVNKVITALAESELDQGLEAIQEASQNGVEMKMFAKLILQKLRFILLLRYAPKHEVYIKDELTVEDFSLIKELSTGKAINSSVLYEILDATERLGHSAIPGLPLELTLIKLLGEQKTSD